jgi:hypothetical protein
LLGTRGEEGRVRTIRVVTNDKHPESGAAYTLTVTRNPRPGYNIGGSSKADAPLVSASLGVKLSVHHWEAGQYWKVNLAAGATLKAMGRWRCPSTSSACNAWVRVHKPDGSYASLTNDGVSAGGAWTNFESSTFSNSGQADTFWIALHAGTRLLDAEMTIVQNGVLPQMVSPGEADVWWFGSNVNPPGYTTALTLTSEYGTGTTWSVVSGSSLVSLSTTQGSQVVVTSTGTAFSATRDDIVIRATSGGSTADATITSRKPHSLLAATPLNQCDSTYGYLTQIPYVILDQLDDPIPFDVPINEQWTTAAIEDYVGNNWPRGSEMNNSSGGPSLVDFVGGPNLTIITSPVPVPTCNGDTTPVDHWGQAWRIGSLTSGDGVLVQTNTLQGNVGMAEHTNVVSPVP